MGSALLEKPEQFHKARCIKRAFGPFAGDGLFRSDGEFWKRSANLCSRLLQHNQLGHDGEILVSQPIIAEAQRVVYNCGHSYTLASAMSRTVLTRTNLLLEAAKIRRLRKALHSRSNSEAVRRVIDERLAVETGLGALQALRKLGGPEDVFGRASAKKR